jgi:ribosomal protein S21
VADFCPDDPVKTDPGICGCGVVDADVDRDGVIDCLTQDLCPSDPLKDLPGVCGCGVKDGDTDGDRLPDCIADRALRFNLQDAIARVKALRLKQTNNLSQAALRKLKKEVREASIFVQSVLAQLRSASRTFPSLRTKRGRRALQEAQKYVRKLRRNLARDGRANLLRSLRTLRNILS